MSREAVVTCDEEIEITVAVVVEKGSGCAESIVVDACSRRDVRESAVGIIAKQQVRPEITDEEIRVAVVVVVTDSNTHRVSAVSLDASLPTYVDKP